MRLQMEGELAHTPSRHHVPVNRSKLVALVLLLLALQSFTACTSVEANQPFTIVVFVCIWKRPLLTDFVLEHYVHLQQDLHADGIYLDLFLVGSENQTTIATATKFSAGYTVLPNNPLGAKHDNGLRAVRDHYEDQVKHGRRGAHPDAITVFGSDDIINKAFFLKVRDRMSHESPQDHVIGLRDIFFEDLPSKQLMHTRGYREFKTPISGTLGCGRVYSWHVLELLNWHLWDMDREHGLDQSAVRNTMRMVPLIGEVSTALHGRDEGVFAVDVKTDGYTTGTNIWRFHEVVSAAGQNGRLHEFEEVDSDATLTLGFGAELLDKMDKLRSDMGALEP